MISLDDLDQAMRDPARGVPAIRRLGGGSLAVTAGGDPWRVVGRASAIYALRRPTGRILALRAPLTDDPAALARLGDRYRGLATDPGLAPLRITGGPLPAEIRWLPDGITLPAAGFRTVAHPLLAMEFASGGTLLQTIEAAATAGNKDAITALTKPLATALVAFERVRFGHGDLRSDNIVLRDVMDPVFIDLDRAAWPGAPGLPPGADPPARDRLPALLLLTELLTLAWRPELWHPGAAADGRLLFEAGDLAEPERSPLLQRLRDADDPTLAAAADLATIALAQSGSELPPISDIVEAIGLAPGARRGRGRADQAGQRPPIPAPSGPVVGTGEPVGLPSWRPRIDAAGPPPPARPAPTPPPTVGSEGWPAVADRPVVAPTPAEPEPRPTALSPADRQRSMTRLNALLLAGDTDAAGRYWSDSGLATDPEAIREVGTLLRALGLPWAPTASAIPPPAREPIATPLPEPPPAPVPPQASDALHRLLPALDAGDIHRIAAYWPEARLDPQAGFLATRVDAVLSREIMLRARRAERLGDDPGLARLPGEAAAVGVALPEETQRAARVAADREARRARLGRAMADGDRTALAELALSGLDDLGRLPPDVQKATARALAWPALERALAADDDAAIVAAADPALFADDPLLPPDARTRIELAYARAVWLRSTRDALRHRDAAALREALADVPPGAEARLSPTERRRIDRLASADAALTRLSEALRSGSDTAIVDALAAVEETGAALPETLDWRAIQTVADRVALIRALRDAAEGDPADALRLARLLPAARALLADGSGAIRDGFDLAALERQVLRAAHLARLRDALASGDPAAIAAAARPDPYGAVELLAPGERERVAALIA